MVQTEAVTVHVATEWIPLIDKRVAEEGYKSRSNYGVSNFGFDLMCQRRHQLITPRDFRSDENYEALVTEVRTRFNNKDKIAAWIDVRTSEQAQDLAKQAVALVASRGELATEVTLCAAIDEISRSRNSG